MITANKSESFRKSATTGSLLRRRAWASLLRSRVRSLVLTGECVQRRILSGVAPRRANRGIAANGLTQKNASRPPMLELRSQAHSRSPSLWWPLLKRGEITRGHAVKYLPIGGWFVFEKTLFDEVRDDLCNLRGPLPNAGVEHPPMKDAVDGVLCIWMPGQIVENFR